VSVRMWLLQFNRIPNAGIVAPAAESIWDTDTRSSGRQELPVPANFAFSKIEGWVAVIYDMSRRKTPIPHHTSLPALYLICRLSSRDDFSIRFRETPA
jgi:hypothetical protein